MQSSSDIKKIINKLAKRYYYKEHYFNSNEKIRLPVTVTSKSFDYHEICYAVEAALDFWLTSGKFTEQFQEILQKYLNVRYAIVCNSGSSANLLAITALTSPLLGKRQLLPGDEIITVASSFPTTINPIIQNQLIPVFADITIPTYNIDTSQLEKIISVKTKAIFLAHTLGNPFNVNEIKKICEKYRLFLIEDNCDALGSKYNNYYTGSIGDISTLSFYPAHHITTGEGGCVLTSSPLLKKIIYSLRDWGRDCWCEPGRDNTCGSRFDHIYEYLPAGYDHKYVYSHIGFNLKATEFQSAIGIAQMAKLNKFIDIRKNNFNYLKSKLFDLKEYIILPESTKNSTPNWFGFPITIKQTIKYNRKDLIKLLENKYIHTRPIFAGNVLKQPAYQNLKYRASEILENTEIVLNNSFWIGLHPGLGINELDYVSKVIHEYFEN